MARLNHNRDQSVLRFIACAVDMASSDEAGGADDAASVSVHECTSGVRCLLTVDSHLQHFTATLGCHRVRVILTMSPFVFTDTSGLTVVTHKLLTIDWTR